MRQPALTFRMGLFVLILTFFVIPPHSNNVQASGALEPPEPPLVVLHDETGYASFIGAGDVGVLELPGETLNGLNPHDWAEGYLEAYSDLFGIRDFRQELTLMKTSLEDRQHSMRYQQVYLGVPILAGELIMNLDGQGRLRSISGEASPNLGLAVVPGISPETARLTALGVVAKAREITSESLEVSEPELWIYDEQLIRPSSRPAELVWRMEVSSTVGAPLRELVLVNAVRGGVSLHFNQVDTTWIGAKDTTKIQSPPPTSLKPIPKDPNISDLKLTPLSDESFTPKLLSASWYVATTGSDSNDCATTTTPCLSINGAVGKAASGDTVNVAEGTYTGTGAEVVTIDKTLTLSGGWDSTFTTQAGVSTIDGQNARRGLLVNSVSVTTSLEYFTIQQGLSSSGGGIYTNGSIELIYCSVIGNTVSNEGGGIFVQNGGALTLNQSVVGDNQANSGGGIFIAWGTLNIKNSTIYQNTSNGGAGINNLGGNVLINNSTVSENSIGTSGGGGGIRNDGSSGVITLQNSIIAGNSGFGPDCNGAITSAGYNIIGDTSECVFSSATGDITNVNAGMSPLDDYGGPTLTYGLYPGSQAIDAGNPATPGSGGGACEASDQRGVARPIDGDTNGSSLCDIGAYEFDPASPPAFPPGIRSTYTANNGTSLPGSLLCTESQPLCTGGSNPHADAAHQYASDTYQFYAFYHARDSIDHAGMTIISTVEYCEPDNPCPYDNAFWNGAQMVFGSAHGYPLADDVVGHELTHGVTQYTSNLFYYYQSGAINESFSDLWGEFIDLGNGRGDDSSTNRWLIGEDITGLGLLRSMKNPPEYGDPDKMTSGNYELGDGDFYYNDYGGVHTNSGVNNKAVYLMADGDIFNSYTVTGIGIDKVAAIYYEVQTNLLTSGADYKDLYFAVQQACKNLIGGIAGITSGDCDEVIKALDAVEMNLEPVELYNPDPPACPMGFVPNDVFYDGFESGTSQWTIQNHGILGKTWEVTEGPATAGIYALYGPDYQGENVSQAFLSTYAQTGNIIIPPGQAFLHFEHMFGFEDPDYDGGVLRYSVNGGSWQDIHSLFAAGQSYNGTILADEEHPLGGQQGFVGDSHGYVSSKYDLSSFAGAELRFRWLIGTDNGFFDLGWLIDEVRVYTCELQNPGTNILSNTSFESYIPVGWQDGKQITPAEGPDCGNPNYRTGSCALKFEGDGSSKRIFMRYKLAGLAGDNFDLNIFRKGVNVPAADGAFIKATLFYKDGTQEVFKANLDTGDLSSWGTAVNLPFTAAKDYKRVNLDLFYKKASGTLWLDDISLTRNSGPELLENTSFEAYKPDDWLLAVEIDPNEGPACGSGLEYAGNCSVHFDGDGTNKRLLMRVKKAGSAGDIISIGIFRKGVNVPGPGGALVKAEMFYTDGTSEIIRMDLDTGNLAIWEEIISGFTAAKDFKRFNIDLFYKKASGTLWLDEISLRVP